MNPRRIAHPEELDDACRRMLRAAQVTLTDLLPDVIARRSCAGAADRMLRTIYGSSWSVAWACLWYAVGCTLYNLQPRWLLMWRYRAEDLDVTTKGARAMPKLEIHYADEWAALYVDGKLDRVGDAYLAEERAFSLVGVKQVQDDAFMRGQSDREGVAQKLEEVAAYRKTRDHREEQAKKLRDEAQQLIARAEELERGTT